MSKIESLTIGEAREIASMLGGAKPCPFTIGQAYLIRTVTMTWTGRVVRIVGDFLVLSDAAWIADTGRYHAATTETALSEVEPVLDGDVIVSLASVVDARPWSSPLPRNVK